MTSAGAGGAATRRLLDGAWRWAALAALLLFLALADAPEHTRFWRAFFEFGHTPLFGVIALVVRGLIASRSPGRPASLRALGLTVALGAVTEVLQLAQPNHDASVQDLLRDAAGAAAFLLIRAAVVQPRSDSHRAELPGRRAVAIAAALALLLLAGADLISTSARYLGRNHAFPTLFRLDGSFWERGFVSAGRTRVTPGARTIQLPGGASESLARIDFAPGRYPGVTFREPYPDWRGYHRLTFTIASDLDAPLALTLRIHDAAHNDEYRDRFNYHFMAPPGVTRVVIPLEDVRRAPARRRMDLGRVRGMVLFAAGLDRPVSVYLGSLRLE